ncbi:MAG: amidohydrolase family protein [Byssovorax sp.]
MQQAVPPSTAVLLQGTVVTPDQVFPGEVLVEGDTLTCVAASCPAPAGAAVVDTKGLIFPGLIDAHNHILFDIFDEDDWAPTQSYKNHNQWTLDARYKAMVDAKQYLNGESNSPYFGCEMDKYGELKGLVAGTTSILGAAIPTNKACYGSLARTIDQKANGLSADKVQTAVAVPADGDSVCTNITTDKTDAYVVHVAEGVDATALNEFGKLGSATTVPGCLYAPETTIVHGLALGEAELAIMGQAKMSMVWSPRSNAFLYGGGQISAATAANVPFAMAQGVNVALGPDWSIGGSQNLLDELRFAEQVNQTLWNGQIAHADLVKMVTINAAKALGLGAVLGSLEAGKKADLMVIGGDPAAPYEALLAATPGEVRLVMVGGAVLYGDAQLAPLGPSMPGCEALELCGRCKFACVAQAGGAAADKLDQTYAQIASTLSTALADYDAMHLTQWTFAPLAPLVKCGP